MSLDYQFHSCGKFSKMPRTSRTKNKRPIADVVDLSKSQPIDLLPHNEECMILEVREIRNPNRVVNNDIEILQVNETPSVQVLRTVSTHTRTLSKYPSASPVPTSSIPRADPPVMKPAMLKCSVCLEVASETTLLSSTTCGHIFCQGCLQVSLQSSKKCPICRKNIPKNGHHRLFL